MRGFYEASCGLLNPVFKCIPRVRKCLYKNELLCAVVIQHKKFNISRVDQLFIGHVTTLSKSVCIFMLIPVHVHTSLQLIFIHLISLFSLFVTPAIKVTIYMCISFHPALLHSPTCTLPNHLVSQARPNQPQHGSLSVSRTVTRPFLPRV